MSPWPVAAVAGLAAYLAARASLGSGPPRGLSRLQVADRPRRARGWGAMLEPMVSVIRAHPQRLGRRPAERALRLAGMDATRWAELRAVQALGGAAGGCAVGVIGAAAGGAAPLAAALAAALLGAWLPALILDARGEARRRQMQAQLPGAIDLFRLCLHAGLTVPGAMREVAGCIPPPLGSELRRACEEMAAGQHAPAALGTAAERAGLDDLASLARALLRAQTFGVPAAATLAALAGEVRTARRHLAEAHIRRLPTKLVALAVCCFLPALFVLTVLPNLLLFFSRW